ncbi:hypothetical protein ASD11_01175 [Aeromicrobium sp. Root495]|uniref:hypothetical protein n=1 Tax=Aeromicrobium sp. Root495 TaxID=1736550 RepID=UPI0006F447E3|nr:hypothetical protein [Aeromicrobium sp. Root495]KQY58307.1 hypothetical protein ASD11_01175 [Aeromicrobium sp. Root495]
MIRFNRYAPARLLGADVRIVSLALAATATVRAYDYLTGHDTQARPPQPGQTPVLVGIEAAAPLWLWGLGILAGTTALCVGIYVLRAHFLVWAGHVWLFAVYLALTIGLTAGYLDRPWLDGVRSGAGLALPTVLHCLLWWRMGPHPVMVKEAASARA